MGDTQTRRMTCVTSGLDSLDVCSTEWQNSLVIPCHMQSVARLHMAGVSKHHESGPIFYHL